MFMAKNYIKMKQLLIVLSALMLCSCGTNTRVALPDPNMGAADQEKVDMINELDATVDSLNFLISEWKKGAKYEDLPKIKFEKKQVAKDWAKLKAERASLKAEKEKLQADENKLNGK